MSEYEIWKHYETLVDKYLDRSVYGHNSKKRIMCLGIADRLIKSWKNL